MNEYLVKLDNSIVGRYNTLERNIKALSNSYYDSFLDLLETTLKRMLELQGIEYDSTRTCGWLLKNEDVVKFFDSIKLDKYTYEKLIDYTKKANDHKHKKEKGVTIDTVVNQLRIYYNFVSAYLINICDVRPNEFDANYYVEIFGITEKLNKKYKVECEQLKSELSSLVEENKLSKEDVEKYKIIASYKSLEALSLDEQNQKLLDEISTLKDIKLNSLEVKLNKTIDMLNDMQEYLFESRIVSYKIASVIDGSYRDELKEAKIRLEEIKKNKIK